MDEIPPKTVIRILRVGGAAFIEARQGMDIPFSHGQMYEANGSQMNMAIEVMPNMRRRLRLLPSGSRWNVW